MGSTATIEANGKRYDAVTGALLGTATAPQLPTSGRNIDGFFRSRSTPAIRSMMPPPVEDTATTAPLVRDFLVDSSKPKTRRAPVARVVNHTYARAPQVATSRAITVRHTVTKSHSLTVNRGEPNHLPHHSQQRSQILRREGVPAPKLSTHNSLKPKNALQHKVPSLLVSKASTASVDPDRLARAVSTPTSPLITRHGAAARSLAPTFASVAVQPMPTPATPPTVPAPTPGGNNPPAPAPAPTPNGKSSDPRDIFEHALANATNFVDIRAQKVRYRQKAQLHIASMAAGTLALVVLAGIVAYQNSPGLQLRLASVRSGVSSHLPALTGTGFVYDGARAEDNRLVLGILGQDAAHYQLTQTNTNLSSADLANTIAATNASGFPQYTVVEAGSTLVYRLSNTSATWIAGGKWYTLSSVASLTDNQLKILVQHL